MTIAPTPAAPSRGVGAAGDVGSLLGHLLDGHAFQPVKVTEVELTDGLRSLRRDGPPSSHRLALVLVRLHSHPLGLVVLDLLDDAPARQWTAEVLNRLGSAIDFHLASDRCCTSPVDLWNGWADAQSPCLEARRAAVATAPTVSVIVATRERPELLARCLQSLCDLEYPDFEIVVVDNAPSSDRTREVVSALGTPKLPVRYLREDRRGLAAAHNAGLDHARGSIVAFTDDDVLVDRHWLSEVVAPFVTDARVGAVTGLIVPAELDTEAQLLLEAHGRYIKGYEPRAFDLHHNRPADPLFPFTAGTMGAGANMAFDTGFLRSLRGFDAALGTGTIARGGDDLVAFFRVVMSGRTVAYRPAAIVWHRHRRDPESVRRQTYDYAVGLGAYLTSAIVHHPRAFAGLLRRLPAGASLQRKHDADRRSALWSSSLQRLSHRGLITGPFAYAASRCSAR